MCNLHPWRNTIPSFIQECNEQQSLQGKKQLSCLFMEHPGQLSHGAWGLGWIPAGVTGEFPSSDWVTSHTPALELVTLLALALPIQQSSVSSRAAPVVNTPEQGSYKSSVVKNPAGDIDWCTGAAPAFTLPLVPHQHWPAAHCCLGSPVQHFIATASIQLKNQSSWSNFITQRTWHVHRKYPVSKISGNTLFGGAKSPDFHNTCFLLKVMTSEPKSCHSM